MPKSSIRAAVRSILISALSLVSLVPACSLGQTAVLPISSATTLAGRSITLPAPGRLTLFVAAGWWAEANSVCARHAVLECYQTAFPGELAQSFGPLFFKRLKKATPADVWDRIAVFSHADAAWKRALRFPSAARSAGAAGPAGSYAILVGPDGGVLWSAESADSSALPPSLEAVLLARDY